MFRIWDVAFGVSGLRFENLGPRVIRCSRLRFMWYLGLNGVGVSEQVTGDFKRIPVIPSVVHRIVE